MKRPDLFLCGNQSFTDVLATRIAPALEKLAEAAPALTKMAELMETRPQKKARTEGEDAATDPAIVIGRLKRRLAEEAEKVEHLKAIAGNSVFNTVCWHRGCATVHEDEEDEERRDLTLDGWTRCECNINWVCGLHAGEPCQCT